MIKMSTNPNNSPVYSEEVMSNAQKQVYNISIELIRKGSGNWFNRLIRECKKKTDLSRIEIERAIDWLIHEKYLVSNSRMSREDVLLNKMRKRIFWIIGSRPGIHFRALMRNMNLKNNTGMLRWHIGILSQFGLIKEFKWGKYKSYFSQEIEENMFKIYFFLQQERYFKILLELMRIGKSTISNLSKTLMFDYKTTTYHLNKLIEAGIIVEDREQNKKAVLISEMDLFKLKTILNDSK